MLRVFILLRVNLCFLLRIIQYSYINFGNKHTFHTVFLFQRKPAGEGDDKGEGVSEKFIFSFLS